MSADATHPEDPERRPLWREPLVHFLVIGGLLYAVDHWRNPPSTGDTDPIVVSEAYIESARKQAQTQSQKQADGEADSGAEAFVDASIEEYIRREALVREARKMGLHRGDKIVRRRLVQKITFLFEDLADVDSPTDADLRRWLEEHPDRYSRQPSISFEHIFFSSDRRDDAKAAARQWLEGETRPRDAGDGFVHGREFDSQTRSNVAQKFGPAFARRLFEEVDATSQDEPSWRGPFESAYGYHAVRVDAFSADATPPLEAIRSKVRSDWLDHHRREARDEAIRQVVERYPVRVEGRGGSDDAR